MTYIPVGTGSSEPDRCPKCKKEEDIKKVCRHCGHEYKDSDCSFWAVCLVLVIIGIGIWLTWTVLYWIFHKGDFAEWATNGREYIYQKESLLEILKFQWEGIAKWFGHFKNMRIW